MPELERLTGGHDLSQFSCGNEELDEWLVNAALTADRSGTARVFVWSGEGEAVTAYIAIAPHVIRSVVVPGPLAAGAPDEIPAVLLAKLALSEAMQGKGHGGELIEAALAALVGAVRATGGRLLVVDAIDEDAATFYEHYGFRRLEDNPLRLVAKVSAAAKRIGLAWP